MADPRPRKNRAAALPPPPTYGMSDDEKRIVAYLDWKATTAINEDGAIAYEIVADDIRRGRHRG